MMTASELGDMGILLKDIPYDFEIAKCNGGNFEVVLSVNNGAVYGTGSHPKSFSIAFHKAKREIEEKLAEEADYQNTVDSFLMGTGRF
ncbi:hypothetical protein KC887_10570 [Candidatus Kaiserbacteria bacterium]|nr:hypothetical protein [Candidatus Kaiserbacteria bacterium]